MFDWPYSSTLEAEIDKIGPQLDAKPCVDVTARPVFWQQMEFAGSLHSHLKLPERVWNTLFMEIELTYVYHWFSVITYRFLDQTLSCYSNSAWNIFLFFEESGREDLNITVLKSVYPSHLLTEANIINI